MARTCPRRASRRGFSKKFRRSWSKIWADRGGLRGVAAGDLAREKSAARDSVTRNSHEASHYSYEDEDQRAAWNPSEEVNATKTGPLKNYNSIGNIAEFFASRGKKFNVPKMPSEEPEGRRGFRPGQKVKHPKYGEGTVVRREGDGEDAKITVQFPRFGLKKLVERYAQMERA